MLGDAQKGMAGVDASKMEEAGEGMMEDMMAQFEALGEKEDYNEVVDGKSSLLSPLSSLCSLLSVVYQPVRYCPFRQY